MEPCSFSKGTKFTPIYQTNLERNPTEQLALHTFQQRTGQISSGFFLCLVTYVQFSSLPEMLSRFCNRKIFMGEHILFILMCAACSEGNLMPNTIPGPVVFVLKSKEHSRFSLSASNLIHKASIPLYSGLVGSTVEIDLLDGRQELTLGRSTNPI